MWEDRLVCPTVQKPLLKSLKRLLPICKEAEKEKKRGDWYSFPRMATCFPQMATNGNNTDWRGGNAHSRPLAEYENCGKWGLRSLSAASIPSSSSTETQTQIRLVDKTHWPLEPSCSTNLHVTEQKRPVHASECKSFHNCSTDIRGGAYISPGGWWWWSAPWTPHRSSACPSLRRPVAGKVGPAGTERQALPHSTKGSNSSKQKNYPKIVPHFIQKSKIIQQYFRHKRHQTINSNGRKVWTMPRLRCCEVTSRLFWTLRPADRHVWWNEVILIAEYHIWRPTTSLTFLS